MNILWIRILSVVGFLVSSYAYYIEHEAKTHKGYKAICDLTESMSCAKAFTSSFGNIGGISNSLGGIVFYVLLFILSYTSYASYIRWLAVASIIGSVFLAYISYFKLKNFCIICTTIYFVNIALLVAAFI